MSSSKRFSRGGTAVGTYEAVKDAIPLYLDEPSFKTKLVCLTMDGLIKRLCDYVG